MNAKTIGPLAAVAIGVAALTLAFSDAGQVAAQTVKTQFVKIINTADEPVPTAAQGTTNIAGTVGISGTPSVNVANTPTVALAPGSSLLIDNNSMNAIPVRDVDNPARQPFQVDQGYVIANGSFSTGPQTIATVPPGKQLVIEHVSFTGELPTGQLFYSLSLRTVAGGRPADHFLLVASSVPDGGVDRFSASQSMRLYADPTSQVVVISRRNNTMGSAFLGFTISGYLVDVP